MSIGFPPLADGYSMRADLRGLGGERPNNSMQRPPARRC